MNKIRYYLLSALSGLIGLVGILGLKMIITGIGIGIAFILEKHIGNFGLNVGWIIGMSFGGLFIWVLQSLEPYYEKLNAKTKTYKNYPYTEKYGRNYPHPKPEDFGISPEEFKVYNGRFQLDFIKLIFTTGLLISAIIYLYAVNPITSHTILLFGGASAVAILNNYLFDYWNKKISQRHRYYEKINEFQQAYKIYRKIQDENPWFEDAADKGNLNN